MGGGVGGCSIYWFVRILARLLSTLTAGQISSQRAIWLPDRTVLPLSPCAFSLSLSLFIIHREVCASVITASLWLSQPCYSAICMADLLRTTTFECCRCSERTWMTSPAGPHQRFRTQCCQQKVVLVMSVGRKKISLVLLENSVYDSNYVVIYMCVCVNFLF